MQEKEGIRDKHWWCAIAQTAAFYRTSSGETAWFPMAEQDGHGGRGLEENGHKGKKKNRKRQEKKDLSCLYPCIHAVGLNRLYCPLLLLLS